MKRFFSVVGKGVGLIGRGLGVAGRATIALVGICGVVAALANYAMTQGSGTNFGSIVVSTVHYVQMLVCDPTTPSQCGAVSAAGAQKVDGSAVTQPVSVASSAVAPGAYQVGALVDGASVTEGATGDAAVAAGAAGSFSAKFRLMTTQLGNISTNSGNAVPFNVNATPTAATALTPGSAQTGTIIAPNSDLTSVGGTAILHGTGAVGAGSPRVAVAVDSATVAGSAPVKGGVAVVNGGSFYQAVAASATATVLQSSAGAAGDYLSHCTIYPTSTSPGVVTVFDNTNAAASSAILFPGGASSLSNLVPFAIPVGAVSTGGAWKVTTGTNVSVVCYGKFS